MHPVFSLGTFILLFGCFLCFLACLLLGYFSFRKTASSRWLTLFYFVCGYALLVSFLLYSDSIGYYPWFYTYRTGFIAGFLFMPVALFYIRSLLQQKVFRRFDLIHFIPAAIFIIDFLPYYLKPASFKLQEAIAGAHGLNASWRLFSQGWLGIGVLYVPLRLALGTFYWIWEIRMILQVNRIENKKTFIKENRHIIQWAKLFCIMQALDFLPYYLNMAFGPNSLYFAMQHVTSGLGVSITIFALLMKPEILHGLKGKWIYNEDIKEEISAVEKKVALLNGLEDGIAHPLSDEEIPTISMELNQFLLKTGNDREGNRKSSYFSYQKMKEIDELMQNHLVEKKPYLNKRYSTSNLSTEISVQPYLISAVISQIHKSQFNDFINKFRVDHAMTLIDNGKAKMFTVEGLADQSGFNNRNSFTLAFKKHIHQTPSDYLKKRSWSLIR